MATEENSQPAMKEPVGRQLQKAREKTGLSTGDVAAAQHLRPSVIQAIESGDYSQIDSELFLKGYVRAYARQVGLDADAVIADLDQELEPIRQQREQEQEANPLVDIERRRRRKRQLAKALFFLVVLGIAGYLAFTFLLPEQDAAPSEAVTESEALPEEEEQGATEKLTSSAEPERSEPQAVATVEEPEPAVVESEPEVAEPQEPSTEQVELDAGEAQATADTAVVEDSVQEPAEPETEPIKPEPMTATCPAPPWKRPAILCAILTMKSPAPDFSRNEPNRMNMNTNVLEMFATMPNMPSPLQ